MYLKKGKNRGIANYEYLALVMRLLYYLLVVAGIVSCNNEEKNDVLAQGPYGPLTDSIKHSPKNADLYYRRGELLYQNNEFNYAIKDIRKAWQLNPKEEYALGLTAVWRKTSEDSAIAFLQEANLQLPQSIALHVALARGYQNKGKAEDALNITNSIIQQYPNQIDALLLKAELLRELSRKDEAMQTLEKAYSYAPFDRELVQNLGFAYAEAGNAKALPLCDSLIKADSSDAHPEPYYLKGVYWEAKKNNAVAIKFFDEAVKHDYYFMDAYMEKGQVLYNEKRYDDAVKTFQLAATVSPTFADTYLWVGKCLEAMGNKADAKLNYQRAYQMDKSMTEAKEAADRL